MIVVGYALRWGAIVLAIVLMFNYNSLLGSTLLTIPVTIFVIFCILYGGFIIQREKAIKIRRKNDGLN